VYVRERASSNLGLLPAGADARTAFRALTTGTAMHRAARLSPDERRLTFLRTEPSGQIMAVLPLDGDEPIMEIAVVGEANDVAWSPVDDRVAIAGSNDGITLGIRIFRPGSAEQRDYLMGLVGADLDWAPNGQILYQRSGNQRFAMLDPATGHDSLLIQPGEQGWVFRPRVSPDGRNLAFLWNRDGELGLWVSLLGDTATRRLAPGDLRPLRWSRDGRRLWAAERPVGDNRERLVEVIYPEGTRRVRDTLPPGFELSDMTRDGRRLIVIRRERQSDAWLIELP